MNSARTIAARFLSLTLIASAALIANAQQATPAKSSAQTKAATNPNAAHAKAAAPAAPETPLPIQIIPRPVTVSPGKGSFALTAHTQIVAAASARSLAEQLRDYLRPATGFPFPIVRAAGPSSVTLAIDHTLKRLGPEGYRLEITRTGIRIRAFDPAGIFYGIQSLRQLLPADLMRRTPVEGIRWAVPVAVIEKVAVCPAVTVWLAG